MCGELNKGETLRSALGSLREFDVGNLSELAKSTSNAMLSSREGKVANEKFFLVFVFISSGSFLFSLSLILVLLFLVI